MQILLYDDDAYHRTEWKEKIEKIAKKDNLKVILCKSQQEVLERVKHSNGIPIVLLDIELNETVNGIVLGKKIHQINPEVPLIFITAYIHYSTEVGEADPTYFLTKPLEEKKLFRALCKAKEKLQRSRIALSFRGEKRIFLQNKIEYVERNKRNSNVFYEGESVITSEKLELIYEKLDKIFFVQCHKSFLVNWHYVKTFESSNLILENDILIPISRQFYQEVKESYLDFTGERLWMDKMG